LIVLANDPAVAARYLSDSTTAINLIRSSAYALSAVFIDMMLVSLRIFLLCRSRWRLCQIYRLWVVWSRTWLVIAPPVAVTLFNCAGFIVVLRLSTGAAPDFRVEIWSGVVYALETATNVYCAGPSLHR
jgi:hypothetical protein